MLNKLQLTLFWLYTFMLRQPTKVIVPAIMLTVVLLTLASNGAPAYAGGGATLPPDCTGC